MLLHLSHDVQKLKFWLSSFVVAFYTYPGVVYVTKSQVFAENNNENKI